MKDHEIAQLVNELTKVAKEFAGAQQLRERISQLVVAAIKPAEPLTWEATSAGLTKFVADARYQKFSPAIQRYYRPVCPQSAEPVAIDWMQAGALIEAHISATKHFIGGTTNWAASVIRHMQKHAAQPAESAAERDELQAATPRPKDQQ